MKPPKPISNLFPYGISDWKTIVTQGRFYVDKTKYIEILENSGDYWKIWRPRRFGKSLFCDQLHHYYDKAVSDVEFEMLFGNTFIGKNKTNERGQHLVLHFSFNFIKAEGDIEANFNDHVHHVMKAFIRKYRQFLPHWQDVEFNPTNCTSSLESLLKVVEHDKQTIYLILDEADSFINRMLFKLDASGPDRGLKEYDRVIYSKESLIRAWGNVVKGGTSRVVKRIFATGVAPVAFADALSSLNIIDDGSFYFSDIFGLTQSDVCRALRKCYEMKFPGLNKESEIDADLKTLTFAYNGFRFTDDQSEGLYNPQACFYYLRSIMRSGLPPKSLADPNVIQDSNDALRFLMNHRDRLRGYTIWSFITGQIHHPISPTFHSKGIFENSHSATTALISLAFYNGYLTFKKEGNGTLVPPNFVHFQEFLANLPDEKKKNVLKALKDVSERAAYSAFAVGLAGMELAKLMWEHKEFLKDVLEEVNKLLDEAKGGKD